jgi:hypothetical protein
VGFRGRGLGPLFPPPEAISEPNLTHLAAHPIRRARFRRVNQNYSLSFFLDIRTNGFMVSGRYVWGGVRSESSRNPMTSNAIEARKKRQELDFQ